MRIVIKIGSSSLASDEGGIDGAMLASMAAQVAELRAAGFQPAIVSSGAIATGLGVLGRRQRPRELPELQAASAIGQGHLFEAWSAALRQVGVVAGQVLLTMHDVMHRSAYVNARNTLEQLLGWDVVPIINENDTTATDEITFGDNDTLAAQVAVLLHAGRLVLLTDTEGLYSSPPGTAGSELIREVTDRRLLDRVDTAAAGSHWGRGGMASKVVAAEMAVAAGTTAWIAAAAAPGILHRIVDGSAVGTRFVAGSRGGSSFKLWLQHATPVRGQLQLDAGAVRALRSRGASLLAVGIAGVQGQFGSGDAVELVEDGTGLVVGKGLTQLDAAELERAIVEHGAGVEAGTPRRSSPVVVHRDALVLLGDPG